MPQGVSVCECNLPGFESPGCGAHGYPVDYLKIVADVSAADAAVVLLVSLGKRTGL